MRQIKASVPTEELSCDPQAAVRLVNELTDRTLAREFEPVQCLEAPEVVALPDEMRRPLDGRSIYTRPGSVRYATSVQLSLEEAATGDAVTIARTLNTANYCAAVSDPSAARAALARSVGLCRTAGDDWGAADGLKMATIACLMQGDDEGLCEITDELWGIASVMGNAFFLAWCHSVRGYASLQRGETGRARDELEASADLCRQVGDPLTAWLVTVWLADLDALVGNTGSAQAGYADTLRRAGATGGTVSQVWGIIGLGRLLRDGGDAPASLAVLEPAVPRFADADPLWRSLFLTEYGAALLDCSGYGAAQTALTESLAAGKLLANPYLIALAQHQLARAAEARGELVTAEALHHIALTLRVRAGLRPGILDSLEALASLASQQHSAAEAVAPARSHIRRAS